MYWYRFYATHGPGHQGERIAYLPSDAPYTVEGAKEAWYEWVAREGLDDAVGRAERVHKLPRRVHAQLVAEYAFQLQNAQHMLEVLTHTHVRQSLAPEELEELRARRSMDRATARRRKEAARRASTGS